MWCHRPASSHCCPIEIVSVATEWGWAKDFTQLHWQGWLWTISSGTLVLLGAFQESDLKPWQTININVKSQMCVMFWFWGCVTLETVRPPAHHSGVLWERKCGCRVQCRSGCCRKLRQIFWFLESLANKKTRWLHHHRDTVAVTVKPTSPVKCMCAAVANDNCSWFLFQTL